MSRIGKKPIPIPKDIKVEVLGEEIKVSRGDQSLSQKILPGIKVKIEDG